MENRLEKSATLGDVELRAQGGGRHGERAAGGHSLRLMSSALVRE